MYNIAIVLISSGMGGGENSVLKLIKNIDKSRFNIFLITNDEHIENYKDYIQEGNIFGIGKMYSQPKNFFSKFCLRVIQRFVDWRQIYIKNKLDDVKTFIENNNIELLHAQLSYDLYLAGSIKKILPYIKTVYTVRGYINFDRSLKLTYGIKKELLVGSLKKMDYVTCVSKGLTMFMQKHYPFLNSTNSEFIPNGLLREDFAELTDSQNKDKKVFKIIYMGGEKSVKGGDIILNIIEILTREYSLNNFEIEILGALEKSKLFYGKEENKHLKITGFVKSPKHLKFMQQSDIIIMPSRSEGFANVALEAIALGLPIVASNIESFKEVIIDYKNGILCDINAELFAKAVNVLMTNTSLLERISRNNRQFEMYWWDIIIRDYEKMYLKILGEK